MHFLAAVVTAALVSSGCAFTDIPLTLPNTGLETTIPGGHGRQILIIIPFSDDRMIRDRCGMQKNGYNMDTADAICQSDPDTWIASLLAAELLASGFSVLGTDDVPRSSALRIDGSFVKIFVEPVIGAWSGSLEADLSVTLRATSGTGLEAERSFFVKGWKGGVMASTGKPFHTALGRATDQLLEEMVRAIIDLMDEYPQLGWRRGGGLRLAFQVDEVRR
jgi:hypothetical protein